MRQLDNESPDNDVADGDDKARKMRRKTEASIVQEEEEGRRNIAPNWRCTIATRILYLVDTLSILTC